MIPPETGRFRLWQRIEPPQSACCPIVRPDPGRGREINRAVQKTCILTRSFDV
jgi:hypothetical protein